jgi:plasmid maintenance system antidote protein VapI
MRQKRILYEVVKTMHVNKLKAKLAELEINVEELSSRIGVERSAMYRKLRNAEKITIGEALKIKEALQLTDDEAYEIFLA